MISWSYMPGWDTDEWDWDTGADRYQRRIDAQVREDLRLGVEPQLGWRGRPVDPMCELHGYGLVDGLCGVCVEEIKARRAAA